jgi:hypothetical protein
MSASTSLGHTAALAPDRRAKKQTHSILGTRPRKDRGRELMKRSKFLQGQPNVEVVNFIRANRLGPLELE